jgi:hypothetical protein
VKLELGCGRSPTPGYVHHDRTRHSDFVDVAFDLREYPWPIAGRRYEPALDVFKHLAGLPLDEPLDELLALDVFEHLGAEVAPWLDECWRVLRPGGLLDMRLPAADNLVSYRDPTHYRVFHEQTFCYWDPAHELHQQFGMLYELGDRPRLWTVAKAYRENGDWRFNLVKLDGP